MIGVAEKALGKDYEKSLNFNLGVSRVARILSLYYFLTSASEVSNLHTDDDGEKR